LGLLLSTLIISPFNEGLVFVTEAKSISLLII